MIWMTLNELEDDLEALAGPWSQMRSLSTADSDEDVPDLDLQWARDVNLDALYHKYAKRSLAFLATLGMRQADADDVMQKSWIKVLEHLRGHSFEGNFRSWLFQILRNTTIDFRRRKQPDSIDPTAIAETWLDNDDPARRLQRTEYQNAVRNCVGKLPEQMQTLVSRRMAGDAYEDICIDLRLTVPQGHRSFFSAKELLARCLSDWEVQS
jgi:RNA polymerase sigma factor (sigma-70 family)